MDIYVCTYKPFGVLMYNTDTIKELLLGGFYLSYPYKIKSSDDISEASIFVVRIEGLIWVEVQLPTKRYEYKIDDIADAVSIFEEKVLNPANLMYKCHGRDSM